MDRERGEYTQTRKTKFDYLRNTGRYEGYYQAKRGMKIIKKPIEQARPTPIFPEKVPLEIKDPFWKSFLKLLSIYVNSILRSLRKGDKRRNFKGSVNEAKDAISPAPNGFKAANESTSSSTSE